METRDFMSQLVVNDGLPVQAVRTNKQLNTKAQIPL